MDSPSTQNPVDTAPNSMEPNVEHSKSTDNSAVKIVEASDCELCDYSSTSITSINRHMVKRHNSIPQFDDSGYQYIGTQC